MHDFATARAREVVASIVWLALVALLLALEVAGRARGARWYPPSRLAAIVGRRLPGRIALVLIWGFVGWHLFARYTLPGR